MAKKKTIEFCGLILKWDELFRAYRCNADSDLLSLEVAVGVGEFQAVLAHNDLYFGEYGETLDELEQKFNKLLKKNKKRLEKVAKRDLERAQFTAKTVESLLMGGRAG